MKHVETIAVLNTDSLLAEKIKSGARIKTGLYFFSASPSFIEFINFELPEITIYNFSDPIIDAFEVLKEVKADPWLHYGGIIGICRETEEKKTLGYLQGTNVIALMRAQGIDFYLPRLLSIIKKNRQILFQRHIQKQMLVDLSGSFTIDNDPFDLSVYSHLITNYLYNADYIDLDAREKLYVALMELLVNAVEHGNCSISYEEKSAWLAGHRDIIELIHEKNKNPHVRAKKVHFRYTITPLSSHFGIADEGKGFDWRKRQELPGENDEVDMLAPHGRGIIMAEYYVRDLHYNKKGNEVSFSFNHTARQTNTIPRAFTAHDKLLFEKGEIVFEENAESDCLYYIVSGKFDVIAQGKKLSTLGPEDMFVGEMSFLLNHRRSATVRASGKGTLLCLSKREFLEAMRAQPHYSIFLARLLAQRLERLNRKVGMVL